MSETRFDRLTRALSRTKAVLLERGISLPPELQPGQRAILILCQGLRFSLIAANIGERYEIVGAYTDPVAIDFLGSRPFDALVIDEASVDTPPEDTIARIKAHAPLRDVPMLVITTVQNAARYQEQGVSVVTDDAQIAARLAPLTLACQTARNARTQMDRLRQIILDAGPLGLNGQKVLEAHCSEAARSAEAPLALALFRIGIETMPHSVAAAPLQVRRSLVSLVLALTRTEDMLFELDDGHLALLLAGADAIDGRIVAERLTNVMESSVTIDAETMQAISPLVMSGVVSLGGYTDMETALLHARRRLNEDMATRGLAA